MIEPLADPGFADAIAAAIDAQIAKVFVAIPARVNRYDPVTQQVDAQILVKREYPDEFGNRQVEDFPIVSNVPVQFLGSGPSSITFPIAVGDTGLLVFCHASIDRLLSTTASRSIDPVLSHHHDINDAVFQPGFRAYGAPIVPAPPTDALVISTQIEVRIGSPNASQAIVGQSALDTFGAALVSAISSLGADPSAAALAALATALGINATTGKGWDAGTAKGKIE